MTTQNLDGQTEEASSIRIFSAAELDDHWLHEGWRIAAIYEVQVLMFENETTPMGIGTTRHVLRPEARFLCVRGARKDLVALLQADVDVAKSKLAEKEKELRACCGERDKLDRLVMDLQKAIPRLQALYDKLSEEQCAERARHRKMEADFGTLRAAIGEIAFKKILGEDAKS